MRHARKHHGAENVVKAAQVESMAEINITPFIDIGPVSARASYSWRSRYLLTLRDVLSTVPGITFGAAEGGIAPSDQITLRGYSASSDITTDGVRDSAPYSRSDPFNLEQVEPLIRSYLGSLPSTNRREPLRDQQVQALPQRRGGQGAGVRGPCARGGRTRARG